VRGEASSSCCSFEAAVCRPRLREEVRRPEDEDCLELARSPLVAVPLAAELPLWPLTAPLDEVVVAAAAAAAAVGEGLAHRFLAAGSGECPGGDREVVMATSEDEDEGLSAECGRLRAYFLNKEPHACSLSALESTRPARDAIGQMDPYLSCTLKSSSTLSSSQLSSQTLASSLSSLSADQSSEGNSSNSSSSSSRPKSAPDLLTSLSEDAAAALPSIAVVAMLVNL